MEWRVVKCPACAKSKETLGVYVSVLCSVWGVAGAAYFCGLRNGFAEKLDLEVAVSGMELRIVSTWEQPNGTRETYCYRHLRVFWQQYGTIQWSLEKRSGSIWCEVNR